jgi:NADH-quinone oxidoreductase subunit G
MDYDPRDNRVYRLRPRDNPQVNKYWMCDDGMMSYRHIHEGRIEHGIVRNGGARSVSPEDALSVAASTLQSVHPAKVAVVLSAHQSDEDNYAAVQLATALGTDQLYLAALGGWQGDKILRSADDNPNRRGARQAAGRDLPGLVALVEAVGAGQVEAVVSLGWASAEDATALAPLRNISTISLSSNVGPLTEVASVVVPVASHGEVSGTFVNEKGMAQQFEKAIDAPDGVLATYATVAALAKAMGKDLGFSKLADLRQRMGAVAPTATATEARA